MKNKLAIPAVALLALTLAVPVFAGGGQCSSKSSATATAMSAGKGSCSSTKSTAWAGAWLQRTTTGSIVVAEVASNSPASRSGLRAGDVVLAVNGSKINGKAKSGEMCADGSVCTVGSSVAYQVKRGNDTRVVKMKLEAMPSTAAERFAATEGNYDRSLAAVVIPSRD
jgi:S1-C subfamily serine protease